MNLIDGFKLKVKRGETPLYRRVRSFAKWLLRLNLPVPSFLKPVLRLLYELHFFAIIAARRILTLAYREPLFRSRCASVGRNLFMYGPLPFVNGHAEIHLGDNVGIGGPLNIGSGRFVDTPRLIIGDRSGIGAYSVITVNREIIIEEDVMVGTHCRISDSDGHRKETNLRAQDAPLTERDIQPVRICRNAWIGTGCYVMKGVTIGEGAIIGANSVVVSDIPPYCLAMGNPAEVFFKNVGRPKNESAAAG